MAYTEHYPGMGPIFLLLFSITLVGIPMLVFISWYDDDREREYVEKYGGTIIGRCETCGDLVTEGGSHRVFDSDVGREVLVCPSGYRSLGHARLIVPEEEREKAVAAIANPMWVKRYAPV